MKLNDLEIFQDVLDCLSALISLMTSRISQTNQRSDKRSLDIQKQNNKNQMSKIIEDRSLDNYYDGCSQSSNHKSTDRINEEKKVMYNHSLQIHFKSKIDLLMKFIAIQEIKEGIDNMNQRSDIKTNDGSGKYRVRSFLDIQ